MNLLSPIMKPLADMSPFTIPLTAANHQTAEKFYQQHSQPQKARQVYLNTLSVLAVDFYLSCLGFRTSLEQSQSWNPMLQVLADTADLWVNDLGRLECRAVLPDAAVCSIPAQVWGDRIGYVIVQLSADLTEASLLGFVRYVETENLPIEQLESIDRLPAYLNSLVVPSAVTVLHHWLQDQIAAGWQTLETLLEGQTPLALSFRTPTTLAVPEPTATRIQRGKFLTLGTPEIRVLFLVEMTARTASAYQIRVELYPTGAETYLPRSLHLAVLDEAGKAVLQAENSNSEGLEFQFMGESGERFSVKISLQEDILVETFEI